MSCNVDTNWLDAYVDESCSAEEREGIESHLRACSGCAIETLNRMHTKRAIRAAAGNHVPSPEFLRRMEASIREESAPGQSIWKLVNPFRSRVWLAQMPTFAVALVLMVGFVLFWTSHVSRQQALAQLLDLHVATTASANPVDVLSTDRHTVKPWFQGKLPYTFNLPELQDTPFKLIGGKLVYFRHTAGAQLLFELRKHEISVFIFQDQSGIRVASGLVREKGFSAESWSEGGLRYTVVGDAAAADIHQLVELLRAAGH